MTRRMTVPLSAALLLTCGVAVAFQGASPSGAQSQAQTPSQRGSQAPTTNRDALLSYHSSQAALYSALTYADALERLAYRSRSEDMDLARSYVHTINREIQAVNDSSVKVGQANHALEKDENMKTLRQELAEALKAVNQAQDAVDGIGVLGPHAKNVTAHLLNSVIALYRMGDTVGIEPLLPPGAIAIRDVLKKG